MAQCSKGPTVESSSEGRTSYCHQNSEVLFCSPEPGEATYYLKRSYAGARPTIDAREVAEYEQIENAEHWSYSQLSSVFVSVVRDTTLRRTVVLKNLSILCKVCGIHFNSQVN